MLTTEEHADLQLRLEMVIGEYAAASQRGEAVAKVTPILPREAPQRPGAAGGCPVFSAWRDGRRERGRDAGLRERTEDRRSDRAAQSRQDGRLARPQRLGQVDRMATPAWRRCEGVPR